MGALDEWREEAGKYKVCINKAGTRWWYLDGILHRLGGPAAEFFSYGYDDMFIIKGERVTESEYRSIIADG